MLKTKTDKLVSNIRMDAWQRWEYKHTTVLLVSLLVFILLLDTALFSVAMDVIIGLGFLGAFLAGIMFPSLFTFAPASTAIILLSSTGGLNPIAVALTAAAGAMVGDFIILRFVEEKIAYELKPLAMRLGIPQLISYLQVRRRTSWVARTLGAFMIASPLPDEIGIGLLGISKIGNASFLLICYVLNAAGILALVMLGNAIL
jgi:hypothetical protein